MPSRAEVLGSVYGAWRIAMLDPDAMRHFNLSLTGFWRSFFAAVLVAPFYLAFVLLDRAAAPADASPADPVLFVAVRALTYVLGWAIFPLAMIPISRLLRLSDNYVAYIIAWNWASVLQMALLLPVAALYASGVLAPRAVAAVVMFAYVTVIFYTYLVTRAGLGADGVTAAGVVAFDVVLSLLVDGAGDAML